MTTFVLLLTLLAQNADFETRYHDAYVLEVVDGKVEDAARRYLDLLREPELPKHLAVQCRFRFAVTCVLLGRADEARARLAALATDPDTPDSLLPQIEEYRKSLHDVGPGRASDEKFDELTLDLAEVVPEKTSQVCQIAWRKWQVFGEAAVPYLLRLLDHADAQLRAHAFGLLCSLDRPGMAKRWDPDLAWTKRSFEEYLRRHPDEVRVAEPRLVALPDDRLGPWLAQLRMVPFSRGFFEKLETRGVAPRLVEMVETLGDEPAREFLARWIREGSPELAAAAARRYLRRPSFPTGDLFGPICLHVADRKPSNTEYKAILRLAKEATPAERMRVLGTLVAAGEKDPTVLKYNVADAVAIVIDGDEFDVETYEGLLRRWLAVLAEQGHHENRFLYRHIHAALRKLPEQRAAAWVREILAMDLRYVDPIEYRRRVEVPWLAEALESAAPETRPRLAALVVYNLPQATPLFRRDIAPLYPRLIATLPADDDELKAALWAFRYVATEVPDAAPSKGRHGTAARALALEVVDAVRKVGLNDAKTAEVVGALFVSAYDDRDDRAADSRYIRNVAIPLLAPLTERLGTDAARQVFAARAYDLLVENVKRERALNLQEAESVLRAYVVDNLKRLDEWHDFAKVEPLIPPAQWLPYVGRDSFLGLSEERRAAAADTFARQPGEITPSLASNVLLNLADDRTRKIVDAALLKGGSRELGLLLAQAPFDPSPDTLEAVLARGLADPAYRLADLAIVGAQLAGKRPTRKLYPLVERLLASEDPDLARKGVSMAESLGQPDLLPKLAKLLDSLDPNVRTAAQNAMSKIAILERLRREARTELETGDED